MLSIKVKTPPDVASELAGRVKARRLELNLTQAAFAAKAGFALDMLADFDAVFAQRKFRTMEEFLAVEKPPRKRASSRSK